MTLVILEAIFIYSFKKLFKKTYQFNMTHNYVQSILLIISKTLAINKSYPSLWTVWCKGEISTQPEHEIGTNQLNVNPSKI